MMLHIIDFVFWSCCCENIIYVQSEKCTSL